MPFHGACIEHIWCPSTERLSVYVFIMLISLTSLKMFSFFLQTRSPLLKRRETYTHSLFFYNTHAKQMSIRRFVSTPEGAKIASALIESLMARVVSSSRGDAAPSRFASTDALGNAVQKRSEQLSKMLQQGAPDFFGADSRTFYRARGILQRAREARALRDVEKRDGYVGEALRLFAQAPLSGDLDSACAELVDLRAFHGVVTLSLSAAATLQRLEEQRKADASTGGRVQAEPDMVRCFMFFTFIIAVRMNFE